MCSCCALGLTSRASRRGHRYSTVGVSVSLCVTQCATTSPGLCAAALGCSSHKRSRPQNTSCGPLSPSRNAKTRRRISQITLFLSGGERFEPLDPFLAPRERSVDRSTLSRAFLAWRQWGHGPPLLYCHNNGRRSAWHLSCNARCGDQPSGAAGVAAVRVDNFQLCADVIGSRCAWAGGYLTSSSRHRSTTQTSLGTSTAGA